MSRDRSSVGVSISRRRFSSFQQPVATGLVLASYQFQSPEGDSRRFNPYGSPNPDDLATSSMFQSPEGDSRRFNSPTTSFNTSRQRKMFQSPEGDSRRFNGSSGCAWRGPESRGWFQSPEGDSRRFNQELAILRLLERDGFNLPKEILVVSTSYSRRADVGMCASFQSPEGDSRRFNFSNSFQIPPSSTWKFQSPEGDSRRFNGVSAAALNQSAGTVSISRRRFSSFQRIEGMPSLDSGGRGRVSISRRRFSSFQPATIWANRTGSVTCFNLPKEILVVSTGSASAASAARVRDGFNLPKEILVVSTRRGDDGRGFDGRRTVSISRRRFSSFQPKRYTSFPRAQTVSISRRRFSSFQP